MTIAANQAAVQQSDAYETFLFTCGNYTFRYTSYHEDVTVDGFLYEHIAIKRGGISRSIGATPGNLTITLPLQCGVVARIRQESGERVMLQVYRQFAGDVDSAPLFIGFLSEWSAEKQEVKIVFKDYRMWFERNIATVKVQCACNNALWDYTCALSRATYVLYADIVSINDSGPSSLYSTTYLVLANNTPDSFGENFTDKSGDYFTHGQIFAPDGTCRMIAKHRISGDVYIQYPYSGLHVGDTIAMYPGCDKSGTTCRVKFNNIVHFVGMPYLPSQDPFRYGIDSTEE
jgi:hypothetical protein